MEIKYYGNAEIIDTIDELPRIGDRGPYLNSRCISIEMTADSDAENDGFVIYRAWYVDGPFISPDINTCYWTFAIRAENIKFE